MLAVAVEEREGKKTMTGTPKDELRVGAAVAMTTDSTADPEGQQRVSVCVCQHFCHVFKSRGSDREGSGQETPLGVVCNMCRRGRMEYSVTESPSNSETAKLETQSPCPRGN